MKSMITACLLVALAGCSPKEPQTVAPPAETATATAAAAPVDVPAGSYTLDKLHASLIFRVDHLGFSMYTARFKTFDAQLQFNPDDLAASQLTVTVDASSLETDFPNPEMVDFNAELKGEKWLDVAQFPEITYRSTAVKPLGDRKMHIEGELTLHGVTRPVNLEATFNGGYTSHPMDPHARIGFSAHGTLNRSEFGVAYGIPAPGTTMGVSDAVQAIIEVEFSGPPPQGATAETSEH